MSSVGSQMKRVHRGDRLFVLAIKANELYALGAIDVEHVRRERSKQAVEAFGDYRAEGQNVTGPFTIAPLGSRKWKLRFESVDSPALVRGVGLPLQVRVMRELTPASANLLLDVLRADGEKTATRRSKNIELFAHEGTIMRRSLSRRERDPNVRKKALARYGTVCQICEFDFAEVYGDFAKRCVEVHHLDPLGGRSSTGAATSIDDVIVICPNCHRAIHLFDDPADWRLFKQECGL
jgi:hypothetical protein